MKSVSTGFGLCVVGTAILAYPIIDRLAPTGASAHAAAVVPIAAMRDADPTVVWMGVTQWNENLEWEYHRVWSDGRLEVRIVKWQQGFCSTSIVCAGDWIEVPPPPAGNGFACRADLNGDRAIDGTDLGILLGSWGDHTSCTPEATFPCLELSQLAK